MKKILLIHNKYRKLSGEDVAVENEIKYLARFFILDSLIFTNEDNLNINTTTSFITNKNKTSIDIVKEKLRKNSYDYIYIHNTWFTASLGVINEVVKYNIPVFLKLHNFRFDCINGIHFKNNSICHDCNNSSRSQGIKNKCYDNSHFKSILATNYSINLLKILKSNNLNIFTLTKFQKDYLVKLGVSQKLIKVVPNHIPSYENQTKNDKKNDKKVFLYAGRLSYEKGIIELIEIWLELDNPNLILEIIGEGPLYETIKEKIKNVNNIKLFSSIDHENIIKKIATMNAVILPTKLYEGQPTILSEASMLGVPSIFADNGGIAEFFPNNYQLKFKSFYELKKILLEINNFDLIELGINVNIFLKTKLEANKLEKSFEDAIQH